MDCIEQIAILVEKEINQYSKEQLLKESTTMNKPVVKKSKLTENQNPEMVVLRLKKKIEILESKKAKVLKENTIKTIQNSLSKALGKDGFDWETVEELGGDLEGFTFTAGKSLTPEQKDSIKASFGNKYGAAKVTGSKTVKVVVAKEAEKLREGSAPQFMIAPDETSPYYDDIVEHPLYSETDYSYFKGRGYSEEEILNFWDRDLKSGAKPVNWKVPANWGPKQDETKVVEPSHPAISGPSVMPMESAVKVRFKTLVEMAANSAKKGRSKIAAGYLKEANEIATKMGYKDWTAVVKAKNLKEGFVNDDPTREEMLAFIDSMGGEFDDFDKEEAMYWFAADCHGGQGSNLYSVLSTSEYTPGMASNGPSDDFLYNALMDEFAPSVVAESKLNEGFKVGDIVTWNQKGGSDKKFKIVKINTSNGMTNGEISLVDTLDSGPNPTICNRVYPKDIVLAESIVTESEGKYGLNAAAATKKAIAMVCESKKKTEVEEGFVGDTIKKVKKVAKGAKNQHDAYYKGLRQAGKAMGHASSGEEAKADQAVRNARRYKDFACGGKGNVGIIDEGLTTISETALTEGVWACPSTVRQAKKLALIMQKPVPFKDASNVFYDCVGDDDLFDFISEMEEEDPMGDSRSAVLSHIEKWIKDGEQNNFGVWAKQWEPEAVAILKGLIAKYGYR
jgi:hypothetical protein